MAWIAELLIAGLLVVGAFFLLVGSFGLAKLPDMMRRLHAPTKATTLGIGALLIASMLYFVSVRGLLSFHELLITLFLFITAPVTAHLVAKAYLLRHPELRKDLPDVQASGGWATLGKSPQDTQRHEA
ncbi:MAG: Na+/H+ antiporter subunit G [Phreatobacter sp.]|nr:Na+/H+ antiporter subunit G [Phreatobacter sp.]